MTVGPGVEPWSSLWGFRNLLAHRLPSEISDERTWAETVADLPGYRATVDEALSNRSDRRT